MLAFPSPTTVDKEPFFATSYIFLLKYLEMRGGKPDNPRAKQGHPVYKPE